MPTPATDSMLARLQDELTERERFIEGIVADVQTRGDDLKDQEMELLTRARDRISILNAQIGPLRETARITRESAQRTAEVSRELAEARQTATRSALPVEYRTTGAYVIDRWRAGVGVEDARERLEIFHRAAAHQTTGDNPGIIPEPVLGPVLNFIDASRPIVTALGPSPVPGGPSFVIPRVTQHTLVGLQPAEKNELASQKMTIDDIPVSVGTYGGYVNVSRQNIDWSQPQIMDFVINDLAAQYAITTETVAVNAITAAPTDGPDIPASPDGGAVAAAVWGAAGLVYNATKGQGRLILAISPDMLGVIGPLFPPINPSNGFGTGFSAANFTTGVVGNVSGITVVMSAQLPAGSIYMLSSAAVRAFDQRIGTLQVTEPSVLGVQVAYAGYFACKVLDPAGVVKISAL